ncbi:MAG: methyl-accepting chemotaxis protein [Elusimicrobia bacterium]|nr:methyl-accepting chemotaxis protein [Elusimicrobiota bacterium]
MTIKRRQYIVKPKLQIKYLLILAAIIVFSSILIYYMFLDSLLNSPGMDQLSAGAVKNFIRSYTSGFFWAILGFMAIVLIESIFYFHRLIGPIFFFEKVMTRLKEGDFSMNVHHRRKDETIELATSMNEAVAGVRNAIAEDRKKIDAIKVAIDSGETDKAKHLLSELTQWFKIEQQ